MAEEWRSVEVLKLLRQCVVCPHCGVLVATQAGIDSHIGWHESLAGYVANVDDRLKQFSDYIVDPETGLQKQIQDRLDTITNYVIAPGTGLEARVTVAIQQLRDDATNAISGLAGRVSVIETEITRPSTGILARINALEVLP